MKEYSFSTGEKEQLKRLFAILSHYDIVRRLVDKEMYNYIVDKIFPRLSLTKEDFPFCTIFMETGKIQFNEKEKMRQTSKPETTSWKEIKTNG